MTAPAAPSHRLIVTIDGPAGTGKSSVAQRLARRLGLDFLDTGAMYRAAAALALDHGIDPGDHNAVLETTMAADMHFDFTRDPPALVAAGAEMTRRLRDADVTAVVSTIAGNPSLRRYMVRQQRAIAAGHPRLVTEGRDQGSVVFPDAEAKFYLEASPRVRGSRRAAQLRAGGRVVDEAALVREIIERDRSDSTRSDGPLVCPPDAERIDTSDVSLDEVVDLLERRVRTRCGHALEGGGGVVVPRPARQPRTGRA
ncbi:MAG TPA: (d)CMP kinase [Phycisphaerales bacterium]|nr:(d)CMP kinase [Phycisphaerales bacterium]